MYIFLKKAFSLSLIILIQLFSSVYGKENVINQISDIQNPEQVLNYNNDFFVIVEQENIFKYYFDTKVLESITTRERNELVGLDSNNELQFCRFEHRMINSYDEFSTTFKILNNQKEIVQTFDFFETIRPISLRGNILIAKTAVDFLEEHYYEINIETGLRKEIDPLIENKLSLNIDMEIKKIFFYNQRILIQDSNGYIYSF